jgi:dihydroorotate dehydrogenase
VIATNTDPQPTPDDPNLNAGVAGGRLHRRAVEVVRLLDEERRANSYNINIIGCGGVQNAPNYLAMKQAGAQAVQYWSTLIYQGPFAAAFIQQEIHRHQQEQSS